MGTTSKRVSNFKFPVSGATANAGMLCEFVAHFRRAPVWNAWRRRGNPKRGLWVVLLGPDGAGKSSVIAGMGSGAAAGFAGCATYHLRPSLLRKKHAQQPDCNPHGRAARGLPITVFKLLYLIAANWLGYLAAVRPRVARGGLVLLDRYFTDCTVDPRRYRMPQSCRWMVELAARMVPKPDLYVVLDAPATVLRERKQEVTPVEVERQQRDYRRLAARLPNAVVVNAAQPLAAVVDEVVEYSIERHLTGYRRIFEIA